MSEQKPKIGVNVFVIKENKLLLGQRKNTSGDGDWGLPGGHLEFGESLIFGANRELQEETGITAKNLIFLSMVNDPNPEYHYLHLCFLSNDFDGEPKVMEPDKCYSWQWFDLNSLPPNIFVGHKKSIKAFIDEVSFVD